MSKGGIQVLLKTRGQNNLPLILTFKQANNWLFVDDKSCLRAR
jgi:hypothetical protein